MRSIINPKLTIQTPFPKFYGQSWTTIALVKVPNLRQALSILKRPSFSENTTEFPPDTAFVISKDTVVNFQERKFRL